MHIRQQIIEILLAQRLTIAGHFLASQPNDVAHPLIVRRQPADGKIFVPENSLQPRSFLAASRVRLMAAVAVIVVDFAPNRLLRVQAKLGIRLAPLDVTTGEED